MRITVFSVIDRLRYGLDAVPLPPGTIVVIDRGYLDVATLYARPRNSSAHHPRQGTACGTPGLPRARSTKQKHWLEKRSDDRTAHPELPQCVPGCAACPTATPKRIATRCSYQSLRSARARDRRYYRNRWQIELLLS